MAHIKHGTLVANTPTTVSLDEPYSNVTVTNRNGVAEIYFRFDGVTPVVGADDNNVVPASITSTTVHPSDEGTATSLQLVSSGACTFTVAGS